MAITTRSARSFDYLKSHGGSVVGPGEYNVLHHRRVRPGFVGFASSDARDLNPNYATITETPGPGSYMKTVIQGPILSKGKTAGFACSSKRTLKGAGMIGPDVPGPGTYTSSSAPGRLPHRRRATSSSSPACLAAAAAACQLSAPAIPDRCVSFGYEQDDAGRVVALKNPQETFTGLGMDTVGPAFYNPTSAPLRPDTHSCAFSRLASKRMNWIDHPDHPGPGDYTLNPSASNQELYVHRGSSSFETRVLRNSWELHPETQDVGPGAYKPNNPAAMKPKTRLPGFMMSSAQHSVFTIDRNPGPGSYESKPSSFRYTVPLKLNADHTGFGTARRPCLSKTQDLNNTPGPAVYDQGYETIGDRVRRKHQCNNPGPFGSSSLRFDKPSCTSKEDEYVGNPYDPLPPGFRERQSSMVLPLRHLGAFSRDRARRVSVIPEKIDDVFLQGAKQHQRPVPGVGTYELRQELAPSHFIPSKPAKATTSFSTAQRFADKPADTPGPGTYKLYRKRKTIVNAPTSTVVKDGERCNQHQINKTTTHGPAPGDYNVATTFNKKSFNITFKGKEKKKGKECQPPPSVVKGFVSRKNPPPPPGKPNQSSQDGKDTVVHL